MLLLIFSSIMVTQCAYNRNTFDALQTYGIWEFVVMQRFLLRNNFRKKAKNP